MGIEETKETLRYFKDVLETDYHLHYFFQEANRIDNESPSYKNQRFSFYALSNYNKNGDKGAHLKKIIDSIIAMKEKEKEPSNLFNLYYSPFLICYKYDQQKFFISPFFIELIVDDLQNPLLSVNEIVNFFVSDTDESFTKNIFSDAEVIMNPALLIEPFEFLDTTIFQRVNSARESKSKSMCADSIKGLFDIAVDFVKSINCNNDILKDSVLNKRLFLKEARGILLEEFQKSFDALNIEKDITILDDSFVFIKNNVIGSIEDSAINGLRNVYREANRVMSEDNLLNIIIEGNKYKYAPALFDKVEKDESTFFITPELNNALTKKHLGALNITNDLTSSQKYCLNMANTGSPIIPVNGPPGTGKTSLLRAIIGDIAVKNAIDYAKEYFEKKESFSFKTPIVSFSTNNRALDNIVEGVVAAYDEIQNELPKHLKPLSYRWINPDYEFTYFDNKNQKITLIKPLNDLRLHVPKIKNSQEYINTNPDYPIYGSTLQRFSSSLEAVKRQPEIFIAKYIEEFNKVFHKFDSSEDILKGREESFLDICIRTLYKEIMNNNKILEEKNIELQNYTKSKQDILEDVDRICDYLNINFRNISTSKEFNLFYNLVNDNLKYIEGVFSSGQEEVNKIKSEFDISIDTNSDELRKALLKIEAECSQHIDEFSCVIFDKKIKLDTEKQTEIDTENNNLQNKIDNYNKEHCAKNIFSRINSKYISKEYYKSIESFAKDSAKTIDAIEDNYKNMQQLLEDELLTEKDSQKNTLEKNIATKRIEFEDLKNAIIKDRDNKIENVVLELKEKLFGIDTKFKNIEELKKCLDDIRADLKRIYELKKFFYDEYEDAISNIYKKVDIEVRTMSFLYAQRLQEALFLFEVLHLSKNKEITKKCFSCHSETLYNFINKNNNNRVFKCTNCDFIFTNHNTTFLKERPLLNHEIIELFEVGNFVYAGRNYSLRKSKDTNMWNIFMFSENKAEKKFGYLSVLFPIVNTTCHSFGSTMPLREKSIDYLFIDEAGMVLSPYIINLYTGKKAFIFGDQKQIEPVCPLNIPTQARKRKPTYDVDDENPKDYLSKQEEINLYLIRKNITSIETKNKVQEFQNVLSSSVMSLVNRSVYFRNRYINRNEIGDLWLTEHFRCRKDIIDYCNEHIYNNIIKPMKPNKEGENHFRILNHNFNQSPSLGGSKENTLEAQLIIDDILKKIKDLSKEEKEEYIKNIGVISPYRGQANKVLSIARNNNLHGIVSGTVHKFQGSERNIIYVSTTIGEQDNASSAFFNRSEQPNIINVAISRAKEEIIIVGNEYRLSENSNSLTGKLMLHIKKTSSYQSEQNILPEASQK